MSLSPLLFSVGPGTRGRTIWTRGGRCEKPQTLQAPPLSPAAQHPGQEWVAHRASAEKPRGSGECGRGKRISPGSRAQSSLRRVSPRENQSLVWQCRSLVAQQVPSRLGHGRPRASVRPGSEWLQEEVPAAALSKYSACSPGMDFQANRAVCPGHSQVNRWPEILSLSFRPGSPCPRLGPRPPGVAAGRPAGCTMALPFAAHPTAADSNLGRVTLSQSDCVFVTTRRTCSKLLKSSLEKTNKNTKQDIARANIFRRFKKKKRLGFLVLAFKCGARTILLWRRRDLGQQCWLGGLSCDWLEPPVTSVPDPCVSDS